MRNTWILFGVFVAGFLLGGITLWTQTIFVREVAKEPEFPSYTEKDLEFKVGQNGIYFLNTSSKVIHKEWECKQLITCEPADWIGIDGHGKAKPEDYCKYEYKTIMSPENPVNFPEYGAYCNLLF